MDEYEVYERTLALLAELGFHATGLGAAHDSRADADVSVTRNGHTEHLSLDYHPHLAATRFDPRSFPDMSQVVLLTDWINEKTAAAFRGRDVQFLDMAGNAHLQSPSWTVDIRGRKPDPSESKRAHSPRGVDIYSPKRAQVIFVLLCWPEMRGAPLREIALASRVSLGLVQSTIRALEDEIRLRTDDPTDRSQLIRDWVSAYRGQLGRTLTLREYHADGPPNDLNGILLSGESAVPELLRSDRTVGYVDEIDMNVIVHNRWRSDGSPNVVLRQKFWNAPDADFITPAAVVPDLLVYADLASSPDVRSRQAAEEFRRAHAL